MKLSIGFSPCPNDTFIFDALVHNKIDSEGLQFDVVLQDVQTLNHWANNGRLDITKLSFPAFFNNRKHYQLLQAGAALGKGVGPLLIAKKMVDVREIKNCSVAIPGENTTANFLLQYAFPFLTKKSSYVFSEIENAVLNEKVDLGVIIHENRFTYQQKGLHKIADLGEVWEQRQQLPVPLGCIAAKETLPVELIKKIETLIEKSLRYAFAQYPQLPAYVQQHAQAMDEVVMRQHIELYVNDFSLNLGTQGQMAIEQLYRVYQQHNGIMEPQNLFV